jgi:predicted ArsR family transcriptional regulator
MTRIGNAGADKGVRTACDGQEDRRVEGQILQLLAEGALAPEQIGAALSAEEADVLHELEELRERGLVERSAIAHHSPETEITLAYWRITDGGRARLEQLHAEGQ